MCEQKFRSMKAEALIMSMWLLWVGLPAVVCTDDLLSEAQLVSDKATLFVNKNLLSKSHNSYKVISEKVYATRGVFALF